MAMQISVGRVGIESALRNRRKYLPVGSGIGIPADAGFARRFQYQLATQPEGASPAKQWRVWGKEFGMNVGFIYSFYFTSK